MYGKIPMTWVAQAVNMEMYFFTRLDAANINTSFLSAVDQV